MITPLYLQKGDKIGIVAPARSITFEEVHPTLRLLRKWSWEPILGTNIFKRDNQFAGNDDQRLADFQQMLDDPSIRAILCARGGYGTVRIIDRIDFSRFRVDPKWIVGYSDITVLHAHIQKHYRTETLHAIMPVNIPSEEAKDDSLETLRNALSGAAIHYHMKNGAHSREGNAEGELTGGNLSILYSLMGTPSEPETDGKILFLEDVDEYLYHIDRMIMNLKRAGKLAGLKGLIIGGMDRMRDNDIPFGKTAQEIIWEAIGEYSYPVCMDFPAGHGAGNLALIFGRNVALRVGKETEVIHT